MLIEQFSTLLSADNSSVISYDGFGKAKIFSQVNSVTTIIKIAVEGGDESWKAQADKEDCDILDPKQELRFAFDREENILSITDIGVFCVSDRIEIPSINVGDPIARVELSTKTWKSINKFGAIADKVHIQIAGNVLSLSAIAPDGVIAMQTLIIDDPLKDGESISFTIPKEALFEAETVSVEIGQEKILVQSSDRASVWAIDRNELAFFPGLIPEGAIEIAIARKDLSPLLVKGGTLKINISKTKGVQLKSPNGQSLTVKVDISCDVPPRTSFQIAAEAVESAIRLIGTAKLITLALPVGLQYIAVSAAAVRCLLPTIVDAAKSLTAQEIVSPSPVVLASETTTVEVDGLPVTMTVEAVEKLDIPKSNEPTSRQDAIAQLESANEAVKESLSRIPPGSELENAKQTIEETLVKQAQAVLEAEKKGCPFSKEDIKRITSAIVRTIARIEAIRFNFLTGELQVTFRS
jgi:hypothetical protein